MKRAVFRVSCFVIVIRKYTLQEAYSEKGRNKHPHTLSTTAAQNHNKIALIGMKGALLSSHCFLFVSLLPIPIIFILYLL